MYRVYLDKTDNYMIQLDIIKGKRSKWTLSSKEELSIPFIACDINNYIYDNNLEILVESPTPITINTHPELFI